MKTKIAVALIVMVIFSAEGCAMNLNLHKIAQQKSISPDHPDYVLVDIISRPLAKKGSVVPQSTGGFHHLAIVSDLLPNGIWEMGPDERGNIITTHTVANLSNWHEHKITQKCLELGGDYIKSQKVGINRNALLKAINLYEDHWVGLKYSKFSQNENYAVESVIFAAGGKI